MKDETVKKRQNQDRSSAESFVRARNDAPAASRLRSKLEATVADLRYYYQLGVELVGESRARLAWGSEVAVKKAAELGVVRDYVEKACQLAREYEKDESFETLLQHLQAMSTKHSFALSRSHVMATLLLETKRERKRFLTDAAKNRWSADCLRAEIRAARPVKSSGGRARKLPETRGQLLIETSSVCRHLIKLRDTLDDHKLKLPDEVWKALTAFQNKCERALKKLQGPHRLQK